VPDIVLVADTTRPLGSANARRLRHHGRIPAVVYGHGVSSTPVSVDARALRAALSTPAGQNVVLELQIDGDNHLAMAKVVDHHPVRHTIAHVDFLVVSRDVKVTTDVPITLVGDAILVTREGGNVEQLLHSISLSMLPSQIPDAIELNVDGLEIGGLLRVSDLVLPDGVTTEVDPESPVVTGSAARVVVEEAAPEAEEGAEPGAETAEAAASPAEDS
jgi:large subunit ribosomal protein L25